MEDDIAEMICGVDREGSGANSVHEHGSDLAFTRWTLASLQPKLNQASPSESLCLRMSKTGR